MDSDEIAVASPENAGLSSPSDDPLQISGPAPQLTHQAPLPLPQDYIPPSGNDDELENDLSDFGFRAEKVNELMSKREFYFDATMQRPQGQTREDRENERKGLNVGSRMPSRGLFRATPMHATRLAREPQRALKRVKVKGEKAEGLVIEGNGSRFAISRDSEHTTLRTNTWLSDWVLFDPQTHDFPRRSSEDVPALIQRYSRYEPGNARILEYNLESASVRLKTTPAALNGRTIEYTNTGPKLVEEEATVPPAKTVTRGRGRYRKRGGRGGGVMTRRKESLSSVGVNTRMVGALRLVQKPAVKLEPKSDGDSGSESSLTDLEAMKEVGAIQEEDASVS